ncbi:exported protein of unknown function [Pseudomonas sp. JV241A]|nr:exported protein of unknown function [Pseudomonas sp. JV241A]
MLKFKDFLLLLLNLLSAKTDSKSVVLATVPRVQIPISPPYKRKPPDRKVRGLFRFR